MNVDGTNYTAQAGPKPSAQPSKGLDGQDALRGTRRENRLAAATGPQQLERLAVSSQDSFEHIIEANPPSVTYGEGAPPRGDEAGSDSGESAAASTGYTAEIVDLETAVNAKGLPLLPESNSKGVFSQEVLDAYEASRVVSPSPAVGQENPVDHLDSLG